jgi:hypothetical protein
VPSNRPARELFAQNGSPPEDRKPVREPPQAPLKFGAAEPVAPLAAAVPRLKAIRAVNNETAGAVDLCLANEAIGLCDRRVERAQTDIRDELRRDGWDHSSRMVRLPVQNRSPPAQTDPDRRAR